MSNYDHDKTVKCDYNHDPKCTQTIPPHKGIPHPVMIGSESKQVIKWSCLPCDMWFDED